MRLLTCTFLVVALPLACSNPDDSEVDGESAAEVRAAFTCELLSGADSRDFSGDGEPSRIELRPRPHDKDRMDANLLGAWDLARPPSRGLPRDCVRTSGTSTEDLLVCRAEPEFDHFETTSTLRAPKGALQGGAAFQLVYHSARDSERAAQGFSEWGASKRTFSCRR